MPSVPLPISLPPLLMQWVMLYLPKQNIKDKVLIAKARWAAHLCSKIHNMAMNSRLAREHMCLLMGSFTAHHKKSVPMAMKMLDDNVAANGKENLSVFGPHFEHVFNNHRPFNLTILGEIAQRPVLLELDLPISFEEVGTAINKLKSGKSPGLNGIPPEAYKAMNSCTHCRIHRYVAAFFKGNEDYAG
jgi:hypothetical protein